MTNGLEIALVVIIFGVIGVIKFRSLISQWKEDSATELTANSERLLDEYYEIYKTQPDDQLERLVLWRKKVIINCEQRRDYKEKQSSLTNVTVLKIKKH